MFKRLSSCACICVLLLTGCVQPLEEDPDLFYPVVSANDTANPQATAATSPAPGPSPDPAVRTPKASPEEAAAALLAAWRAGDRDAAGQVASPGAVATLFALDPGPTQGRGCAEAQALRECAFRYGDSLLRLNGAETDGGWIIEQVEND